jgi:tetratricopeptide (TPR) repeat protein
MARTIGRQIQGVLSPETEARLTEARPVNPEAYELTLRGRYLVDQLSQEALERSIRYFEGAIEADPDYAPAHSGLALAYYSLSSAYRPPLEVMPLARAAAERAIELDPNLAEAHTWLGIVHLFFDHDWEAAGREFELAIDLNPSSAEARTGYSNYLLSVGRLEEAVAEVLVGESLVPGSVWAYASPQGSQWTTYMARNYDLAVEKGREALALDSRNAWARGYYGIVLQQIGETEAGLAELEEANRLEDTPLLKAFLANGYAVSGRTSEARALLSDLEEISRQQYTCAYEIAVVHATLGDVDEALAWLYKARADRADCIPYLNIDPRFDSLRSDPRFQALLDEIGFVSARQRAVAHAEPVRRRRVS